ncbi:hypothetical protein LSH36_372g02006, partial [Paralvinella palmiformis]
QIKSNKDGAVTFSKVPVKQTPTIIDVHSNESDDNSDIKSNKDGAVTFSKVPVKQTPTIIDVHSNESDDNSDVKKNMHGPFIRVSVCLLILSAIDFFLSIAMLVVGSIFYDKCRVSTLIPVYLIVGGSLGLVLATFLSGDILGTYKSHLTQCTYMMFWISVLWHCVGLIITIRIRHTQHTDPTAKDYCIYELYHFALYLSVVLTVGFVVLIAILIFICVFRPKRTMYL